MKRLETRDVVYAVLIVANVVVGTVCLIAGLYLSAVINYLSVAFLIVVYRSY